MRVPVGAVEAIRELLRAMYGAEQPEEIKQ